jgi:hypothetical protein
MTDVANSPGADIAQALDMSDLDFDKSALMLLNLVIVRVKNTSGRELLNMAEFNVYRDMLSAMSSIRAPIGQSEQRQNYQPEQPAPQYREPQPEPPQQQYAPRTRATDALAAPQFTR